MVSGQFEPARFESRLPKAFNRGVCEEMPRRTGREAGRRDFRGRAVIDKDGGWFGIVRTCFDMAEGLLFHSKNRLGLGYLLLSSGCSRLVETRLLVPSNGDCRSSFIVLLFLKRQL